MKIIIYVLIVTILMGCNSTPSARRNHIVPSIIMPGAVQADCANYRNNWWATQRRKIVIFLSSPTDYDIIDACKKQGFRTRDIVQMGAKLQ